MHKLLLAICVAAMTPEGPRLANCQVLEEKPERWYLSESECIKKAQELQTAYDAEFRNTGIVGRLSCVSKKRLEEIHTESRGKIKA